jgi:hypothetical protein
MELVFDLTKDDYINFNIDHLSISDITKKRKLNNHSKALEFLELVRGYINN